jgi:elongation factor 2
MAKGQYIIAGAGELHLDVCLRDLEKIYAGVPIRRSDSIVSYKETVLKKSSQVCLAKSGNKHNRVYMTAEPLSAGMDH